MLPAEIAAAALDVAPADIVSVEPIKHGLTNESWRVKTASAAVVVRISTASDETLQIDRDSEERVLRIVGAAGIGPAVIRCDPAQRVLVTRDLGAAWSEDEARIDRNIERLAQLLRRLHELPPPAQVRTVDLQATVRGYLATLETRGEHALLQPAIRARSLEVARRLNEAAAMCLCHNDVHHLNVIDNGRLRLIDWEYAGLGEPLFDLASVCVYHGYDKAQRERLLSAYLMQPDRVTWHRLELACWLFDYVRELWLAVRGSG